MKAEIIAVGSELLLGDVINSNAAWISKELAALGVDVHYHLTVGDNTARIQGIMAQACERSDLLIFTGGLGPTDDDLTIATIADFFRTPVVVDPESAETIRKRFMARGMPLSPSNLKQAQKPEGAETVKNPVGTAPGIAWEVNTEAGKPIRLLTFPGVPKELYAMWAAGAERIRHWQRQAGEAPAVLLTRHLHFFGIGESRLGELLSDLMQSANPTVAPYVGRAEVTIRVAAKADSPAAAEALVAGMSQQIVQRCPEYYFGDDEATMEAHVSHLLRERNWRLAVAESCTGGLLSSRLTDVPGSSAYTHLNVVTYSNAEKTRVLGVSKETLATHGAVSAEVARAMAEGLLASSGADVALSITGIAGPDGGSEEKPVGLAYIGIAQGMLGPKKSVQQKSGPGNSIWIKKVLVNGRNSRQDIKHWFTQYALSYLAQALQGKLESDVD
ncbi:competence/damage-inducible protein A [Vampirovibrio chlorellavorus]|uniref:competence/damage-inducible protein A n=1 Tax=Vampirovibrio chlorellavorus TaxID=758823 RepID=UPI0026EDBC4F|nr:competence/damage-inducible protein A [Vampirovibrio chlorellavorus]